MTIYPIEPPRELLMPEPWQQGALVIAGSILTFFVLLAMWQLLRRRDPLLLYCLIGGAAAVMLEPITNVLGQAYHPEIGQIVGYRLLGRDIPLHIALIYPWYFGAYVWALLRVFERGPTRAMFWKLAGYSAAFAFCIEIVPVHIGLWKYYGAQPFDFYGMPLWWYVVNPTSIVGAGAVAWYGTRCLQGWGRWPLMVLIPFAAVAVHTGLSAPIYMGLNSDNTVAQNVLPGLLSIAFSLTLLFAIQRLVVTAAAVPLRQSAGGAAAAAARVQPLM